VRPKSEESSYVPDHVKPIRSPEELSDQSSSELVKHWSHARVQTFQATMTKTEGRNGFHTWIAGQLDLRCRTATM
jgi:hypothetical protein